MRFNKLSIIILAAICIRLALVPVGGYAHDVRDFSGWMLALPVVGFHGIYNDQSGHFFTPVDYPPGYLYILWALGEFHRSVLHGIRNHTLLMVLLKTPAVVADFVLAFGIFRLSNRCRSDANVPAIAMILLLSPLLWLVSAYWAQVDSVAAAAFVWTLVAAVEKRFTYMWIIYAVAILLKPQPIVAAPCLILFQLMDSRGRRSFVWGPLASITTAYILALPFAQSLNPITVLRWLFGRYVYGVGKFPNNSSGAFNLYSIFGSFYTKDSQHAFGLSLHVWGGVFFLAMLTLIVVRVWNRLKSTESRDHESRARLLISGVSLIIIAMFMFSTRMHERYIFSGLVLLPLLADFGKNAQRASSVLYLIFVINLIYILCDYHVGDPNSKLYLLIHPLSALNVGAFIILALSTLFKHERRIRSSVSVVRGDFETKETMYVKQI
jgi:dolichyl-phosphate-mannose-protein mannosyltransferase